MKAFLDDEFLLQTQTAQSLYHEAAEAMPIFDFHCHLPVSEIAEDRRFPNLTQVWLNGDHYKWRAMRAAGIPERLITGDAGDEEKFKAWAATVPKTLCNPLYHWTHLELKRYFGIGGKLLNADTAKAIYDACAERLQSPELSARGILRQMNVRVVCTTDDPTDSLEHHLRLKKDRSFPVKVLPAFRPDKALAVESPESFNAWIDRLESASEVAVKDFAAFLEAIKTRHDFFHELGCRISDHGLEHPYAEEYSLTDIRSIFERVRAGRKPETREALQFKSAVLAELARMDADRGWTQQFHLGALRNVNRRAMGALGPDTGYDSIGDRRWTGDLARFLDTLDRENRLAKTILYVVNPSDNEAAASMIGNFQDGSVRGKMQFGAAWWFNDQKDGIERQLKALSLMGLLSGFVGMVTDSRSFLSYPRHEYFRRVLCNVLGTDVEKGELPADLDLIGNMVRDICFRNAVNYFGIPVDDAAAHSERDAYALERR